MRADTNPSYAEIRDGIDQRWLSFLLACNLQPIIVPNNLTLIKMICAEVNFDGLLLTGGNNVASDGLLDKNRDECENILLQHALDKDLPVLGVCRGMQFISHYFGSALRACEGHVTESLKIVHKSESRLSKTIKHLSKVNSYHNFQVSAPPKNFEVLVTSEDSVIKCIEHNSAPIMGIMWHPERDKPFVKENIQLFQQLFQRMNTIA
ncbi:gamma-glutamyl-gamma-aminobutyrate hydrolase family protein [Paraglaciecola aquimarina]|uniref:Gamma-glutamyl-gamma-aminobutyrate hydrolase family protein n=1 Tax=Paraglaciecola algarum TaxID=3050085 RepID=A0ABS9D8X8_9ALTE|nr:gamma-glutamyl-gamma-aminobutyrate hydrolase family protein [Paraglaciecola sp. G1-23]MCF2948116.1 gamma-glutamyl-gamma-aminobutyrate hydrolase family protein [Paraglaciecola sp. G1-23]